MANFFDLQIHSIASDGRHAPREVVEMAKEKGVLVISLTDHDTVYGLEEAIKAGAELGVKVTPGVELSVEEHGAHILGYGIDYRDPRLVETFQKSSDERILRVKQMVENLKNNGFIIDWEDVLREVKGGVITRPHISRAVVKRKENKEKLGDAITPHEFLNQYLSDQSPNYVRGFHLKAEECISLIRAAGGIAVWSHPPIPDFMNAAYDELEKFLKELISWGLKGVEVFNSSHHEDDVEFVESMAQKYKLLRTAGSDFHEQGEHPRDESGRHAAEFVGDFDTYGFETEDIVSQLEAVILKKD